MGITGATTPHIRKNYNNQIRFEHMCRSASLPDDPPNGHIHM